MLFFLQRLSDLSIRIQRLDISLSILEAKLISIPSLEGVQATQTYEPPSAVATAGNITAPTSQPQPSQPSSGPAPPPPPSSGDEPMPQPTATGKYNSVVLPYLLLYKYDSKQSFQIVFPF